MKKLILVLPLIFLFFTTTIKAQFGNPVLYNNSPAIVSYTTLDYDHDGDLDVAWIGTYSAEIYINNGIGEIDSSFSIPTFYLSLSTVDRAVQSFGVDVDSDGWDDLLVRGKKNVFWYRNNTLNDFDTAQVISNVVIDFDSDPIEIFDIDGDGDMDIVNGLGFASNQGINWYENTSGGVFSGPNLLISMIALGNGLPKTPYPNDIDNDGDVDIFVVLFRSSNTEIYFYENLGNLNFSAGVLLATFIDNKAYDLTFSDLNNDGKKDITFFIESGWTIPNTTSWASICTFIGNGGGNFTYNNIDSITFNHVYPTRNLICLDIDIDGDIDILTIDGNRANISFYQNNGSGGFLPKSTLYTAPSGFDGGFDLDAKDFDLDGDQDLIWRRISTFSGYNHLGILENFIHNQGGYTMKGNVFFDSNQNKIKDSIEFGFSNTLLNLIPSGITSYSYIDGSYFFAVDSGTYNLTHNPLQYWNLTTDSSSYTRTLSSTNNLIDSLNFGFYPDTLITVIRPTLTGGFPRCNQFTNYWVNIQNIGTTTPNGVIHLQLDDSISYISAAVTPDSIINQNIYWHYDSLFFYSSEMINLQVQMPPFTSMGDTLTSILTVHELDSLGSSNIIYSNTDTLDQILVCAYDPNDKSVTPKGIGNEGYIAQNQELEYLIRFQNTGNDTAITVTVRDQLDADLDWNTLFPIASSHTFQVHIAQNGEVVFKFENIFLPDSATDFLGSQGFVKFTIKPKANLSPNTPIYNAGHIYFDYNPAVITNIVLNTIECYGTPQPIINYNFPYLESGVSGNYSYQWYLNDTLIAGATSATYTPLVNGDYTVTVLDTNNCPKHSLPYTYNSVGIEEISQLKSVVFPNPFSEFTTILFDKSLIGEYDLLVYDIIGKEVKRVRKITGNKVIIDKRDTGKGLFLTFLVNNQTGEKIFIEKLIVR